MRDLLLAGGAILALGIGSAGAQERVAIGTGGTGGVFYAVGAAMAELINDELDGVSATAEVTGASVENNRRVSMGEMQLGFSSASTLYAAANGEDPFEETQNVAAVAYLYPAALQIAALSSTGAQSIEDLSEVRLGIGPPGSNSAVIAERLLTAYDALDMANIQFLSYNEATQAIRDGNLDASAVLAGIPAAALIELATTEDVTFIPVEADRVAGLLEEYPFYEVIDMPAGTYDGQDAAVGILGDPAILFTSADADEELVYTLTATIFDNLDRLGQVHPAAALISLDRAEATPIPLHPGAARYFEEHGN